MLGRAQEVSCVLASRMQGGASHFTLVFGYLPSCRESGRSHVCGFPSLDLSRCVSFPTMWSCLLWVAVLPVWVENKTDLIWSAFSTHDSLFPVDKG